MRKLAVSLLVAAALAGSASLAAADSKDIPKDIPPVRAEDVAYDILVARPAAWLYLAVGTTMYVPASAVTWAAGKATGALEEELVSKRYRYAAERPWGRF